MFKHANTYFPGDRVVERGDGTKVSSEPRRGSVVGSTDGGDLCIKWDSGDTTTASPDTLDRDEAKQ